MIEAPPRPQAPPPSPPPSPARSPLRRSVIALVAGPVILGLLGLGMVYGIKAAYGGFADTYDLMVDIPRAGQVLEPGSDVRFRGVPIGEVARIELVDRRVRLTLEIDREYSVPADVRAVVALKTLLGAKFIDLRTARYGPPWLEDGGTITRSHVGPELEDALADGVSVLEAIRPEELATVISELARAARGHGEDVARGLVANRDLSDLFAETIAPQLEALHDFRVVFGALEDRGVDLNRLADALNEGVPVYASPQAQAELHRALVAVAPFAENLADLLILQEDDWDTMLDAGDLVLGTIAGRPLGLRDLVAGLAVYVTRLGGDPLMLANGSAMAGFSDFIGGNNPAEVRNQLCDALPLPIRENAPLCEGLPLPVPTPPLP